jgi:hypothetical protein
MIYWILSSSLFVIAHAIKLIELSVISIMCRNKAYNFQWRMNSRGNRQVNMKKEDAEYSSVP